MMQQRSSYKVTEDLEMEFPAYERGFFCQTGETNKRGFEDGEREKEEGDRENEREKERERGGGS